MLWIGLTLGFLLGGGVLSLLVIAAYLGFATE